MKRSWCALLAALCLAAGSTTAFAADPAEAPPAPVTQKTVDDAKAEAKQNGDIAWMLVSSGLVLLMVPGLALFYGGMVRRKNVLATMMQSMAALAVVGVFWIAVGYCLAFGKSQGGWIGWSPDKLLFLKGVEADEFLPGTNIPIYVHVMFQGMFAIITPALISGAIAERIRFGPYCLFMLLWVTVVYCPLAHWVWAMNWWDEVEPGTKMVGVLGAPPIGAFDFAGGTVVHIAAGVSGLAAILLLRKRLGYPHSVVQPNSMVLTVLGAGLLWFGWFGFNGGSALGSNTLASSAFAATQAAAAAAALSWLAAEWLHRGKPTGLGLASGLVAGLVAVTPASGFVYPWGGLAIGLIAGVVCYGSVLMKGVFKYDDALDAFGVHGVGGFLGAVLTGVFCFKKINAAGTDGLLAGGGWGPVVSQLQAAGAAALFAFVLSVVLVKLVDLLFKFTSATEAEITGLDITEHGEVGFDFGPELEHVAVASVPKAASTPPAGQKRFTLVVEGAPAPTVAQAWSKACEPGAAPTAELKALYPHLTTVQGNRFRFRGGEAGAIRENLLGLLKRSMNGNGSLPLQAHTLTDA